MKPTYCAFHQKQLIVNFCRNQNCLLPMCPNCIKIHSKQHKIENSFGQFQSIHDVYSQVQSNLINSLKSLKNFNQDLKQTVLQKQVRRESIKKKMGDYRQKLISHIQRYIDQIQTQILNSMGGMESNLQEDFNTITQKIQILTKQIQKQEKILKSQKVLKQIITHLSQNKEEYYEQKMDQIQQKIADIQSKDITVCKQFRLSQMEPLTQKVHQLYKSIFVGIIKPITLKNKQSRISRISRSHDRKESNFVS